MGQTHESKFCIEEIVELEADNGQIENRFGHVTKISFRKTDAVNFVADYMVQLFNQGELVEVMDSDILNSYGKLKKGRGL